tara:strand:- start:636 stop:1523 length:888 start_codon:yes stop_codon:yes gene_type:complete
MGKTDASVNLPTNASLSYTLNALTSTVEIVPSNASSDSWLPLVNTFKLSTQSQNRFLSHLQRLKEYFKYTGHFHVASCNSFPLGCGLASSASSFAALTKCAVIALSELTNRPLLSLAEQAMLSRQGSGSSCRSFFSPWARWHDDFAQEVTLPYQTLLHQVIVISDKEKAISSSKAHRLVTTSPAFNGRIQRAEDRLINLTSALNTRTWETAFELCWAEFIDMHHLFQTAQTPFDYMTDSCRTALHLLDKFWGIEGNGPLVTMDAGPNIHLLYRPEDKALKEKFEHDHLKGRFNVI